MADYLVTGQRGAGKGIIMVSRMEMAFRRGCVVATNMDIDLSQLYPIWDKRYPKFPSHPVIFRVPDFPCSDDIMVAGLSVGDVKGVVTSSLDESKFGELILDELQVWLNSRGWSDPRRTKFMLWLPLSRKFGWNTYFTSQTLNGLDKQARDLLEHHVHCVRTDRMGIPIPLLGTFLAWLGNRLNIKITLPRVHMGTVMYGRESPPMIVDRWHYRGTERIKNAYNTRQKYSIAYSEGPYATGTYQYLPQRFLFDGSGAWVLKYNDVTGRYGRSKFWERDVIWATQIDYYKSEGGRYFDYPGRPEAWGNQLPYLIPPPLTVAQRAVMVLRPFVLYGLLLLVLVYALALAKLSRVSSVKSVSVVSVSVSTVPAVHSFLFGSDGSVDRF